LLFAIDRKLFIVFCDRSPIILKILRLTERKTRYNRNMNAHCLSCRKTETFRRF